LAQFVFASAARIDNGAAIRMLMVSMIMVFIVLSLVLEG
jgi:hypothetical protein